jgi:hypothetical protein
VTFGGQKVTPVTESVALRGSFCLKSNFTLGTNGKLAMFMLKAGLSISKVSDLDLMTIDE